MLSGWVTRDGRYIEVEHQEHNSWALEHTGKTSDELINLGWIKITWSDFDHKQKVYWRGSSMLEPSVEQENTIHNLGLTF